MDEVILCIEYYYIMKDLKGRRIEAEIMINSSIL